MKQAVPAAFEGVDPDRVEQLLTAFVADLKGKSPENFLSILDKILRQVIVTDGLASYIKAIAEVFGCRIKHVLCRFHYLQNLHRHIDDAFGAKNKNRCR